MVTDQVRAYLDLIPALRNSPPYDEEADTLYIKFKKPSHATDSEITDDDIIIRYEGDEVVGMTIPHASKR